MRHAEAGHASSDVPKKHRVRAPPLLSDLAKVDLNLYVACFVVSTVFAVGTLLISSSITPIGRHVYFFLQTKGSDFNDAVGFSLYQTFFGVGIALIFSGYLLDVHKWSARVPQTLYAITAGGLFLWGFIFYTNAAPSVPIILGVVLTFLALAGVRYSFFRGHGAREFAFACTVPLMLISIVFAVIWITWAGTHGFRGYEPTAGTHPLTAFMLWSSPIILAAAYFVASLFTAMRGRFHVPDTDECSAFANSDGGDHVYVGGELKVVGAALLLAVLGCWIATSVGAHDIGLSRTVLRLSAVMVLLIIMYVGVSIGPEKLNAAIEANEMTMIIAEFVGSDWMKGLALLVLWPLVPVYFLFELIHQCVRIVLRDLGVLDAEIGDSWLTVEAVKHWNCMSEWDWSSVLLKSIHAGLIYFLLQVGVLTAMTVFLSWLSVQISSWSLGLIVVVLFFIGLGLFLLPPVPGLPIYLVSGIVLVQKCQDAGTTFFWGVFIATAFCFVIKMTANIILQKVIGELCCENITVKKTVGLHTPTMKAVERILMAQGLDPGKIAVLVGGPDWPTAVMTGIMKVRVVEMLIGSIPCFVLILPVVLASAFMLKAGEALTAGNREQSDRYTQVANVMMMVSAIGQVSFLILAANYLQGVKDEFREEFGKVREEDVPVIEALDREEREHRVFAKQTRWAITPTWLRCVLLCGSFSVCIMMHIIMEWIVQAFRVFTLRDHIADLPGGKPWNVILVPGWVAIFLLLASIVCLCVHSAWCRLMTRGTAGAGGSMCEGAGTTETTPLLSRAA